MSWVYSWGRDYNYIPKDYTVKRVHFVNSDL